MRFFIVWAETQVAPTDVATMTISPTVLSDIENVKKMNPEWKDLAEIASSYLLAMTRIIESDPNYSRLLRRASSQ